MKLFYLQHRGTADTGELSLMSDQPNSFREGQGRRSLVSGGDSNVVIRYTVQLS